MIKLTWTQLAAGIFALMAAVGGATFGRVSFGQVTRGLPEGIAYQAVQVTRK